MSQPSTRWLAAVLPTLVLTLPATPVCATGDTDDSSTTASVSGVITVNYLNDSRPNAISNAIVFLDGANPMSPVLPATAPVIISQSGQVFSPRVAPVQRGTTLRFANDDNIFHNVFSLSRTAPFDLGIYPKGTFKDVTTQTSGLIKVYCNIHPDMVSNVLVLDNPWFAETNADGSYRIDGIVPGDYTLRVWHEYGGEYISQVTLKAGANYVHSVAISNSVRSRNHKNKFGRPYRKKY